MSPPKYRSFSYNPEAHSAVIEKSVLQKKKEKNPALYAKLMTQKISNQDENSSTANYLTKQEIEEIRSKYSGGDMLEKPNIGLEHDIGNMITPDGEHIPKSFYPKFEK